MKKSLLLILSLFLASVCGRAGVPGLVLGPGPNSGTRFQMNAPFECFNNDKRISDANGYLELFVFFDAHGKVSSGNSRLFYVKAGILLEYCETDTGVSGMYLLSGQKVSLFVSIDSSDAIQILYNVETNEIENSSLISKTYGTTLKIVFRDRLDLPLQARTE
jgi:hypothetical protein